MTPTTDTLGFSGQTALVHKKDAEGMIKIDAMTGHVLPGQRNEPDFPEWADELVLAQLAERHLFYSNRLGPKHAAEHESPELYAFEDLGWLGFNREEGREYTIEADDEHRMEVLGTVLGVDRETGDIKGALAEAEIGRDDSRTEGEIKSFTEAQQQGFGKVATAGDK